VTPYGTFLKPGNWEIGNVAKGFSIINLTMKKLHKLDELGIEALAIEHEKNFN
jgi:hypothetical protein